MHVLNKVGVGVFVVGILIMMAYSVYPLFNMDVEDATMLLGVKAGLVLMGIGAAILILTMSIERYRDWKKMKKEIDEKELRP